MDIMDQPERAKVVFGDGKKKHVFLLFEPFLSFVLFCFFPLIHLLLDNLAAGKEEVRTSGLQVNSRPCISIHLSIAACSQQFQAIFRFNAFILFGRPSTINNVWFIRPLSLPLKIVFRHYFLPCLFNMWLGMVHSLAIGQLLTACKKQPASWCSPPLQEKNSSRGR